jgi:hypothetical protein
MRVRKADCCKNCAHVATDFHFRDAILCSKSNEYRYHNEVCELLEMDKRWSEEIK